MCQGVIYLDWNLARVPRRFACALAQSTAVSAHRFSTVQGSDGHRYQGRRKMGILTSLLGMADISRLRKFGRQYARHGVTSKFSTVRGVQKTQVSEGSVSRTPMQIRKRSNGGNKGRIYPTLCATEGPSQGRGRRA